MTSDEDIDAVIRLLEALSNKDCNFNKWKKTYLVEALQFLQKQCLMRTDELIVAYRSMAFIREQVSSSSILQLIRLRSQFRTLGAKDLSTSDDNIE